MTDLQLAYRELRAEGRGHYAAVRELARRMRVDSDTVIRVLDRAQRGRRIAGHSRAR